MEPGSRLTSCSSVRTLPPRPRRLRPWLQEGTGAPGLGARQGRRKAAGFCPVTEPVAQLHSSCLSCPLRKEGCAELALEGRATLGPHSCPVLGGVTAARHVPSAADGPASASRWPPHGSGLLPSACRAHQDPTSTFTKIYKRSFCLLQAWLEDCYAVDFTRNSGLLSRLEDFISSKVTGGRAPEQSLHRHGLHSGAQSRRPGLGASDRLVLLPRSCPWTAPPSTCWASWRWAPTGGPRAPRAAPTWRTPRRPRTTPDLSMPSVRGSQKTASPGRWGPLPGRAAPSAQPELREHGARTPTHAHTHV